MATGNLTTLAREIYDAFNNHDLESIGTYFADDCKFTEVATNQTYRGPNGIRQNMEQWRRAFPDARMEVTNVVAFGDWACVEFVGRGTHTGPFQTPGGTVEATGRRVELQVCDLLRFKNDKVIDARSYYDTATMTRQLGL
jgi:steroid delta-isomerase-like uncharacterized protein